MEQAMMGGWKWRVVVLGGGTGCPQVLRGLRGACSELTAIVTMFDSGGSSGRLRRELGCPPLGDLRRCLEALATSSSERELLVRLMEYRFPKGSGLAGHSLGNLLLAGLMGQEGGLESALAAAERLLGTVGHVLPVTLDNAHLCARLADGSVLRGEDAIDKRTPGPAINGVFLDPPAKANPRAVEAIQRADAVVIGPGDLYTSVIPNLLVRGIPEAIRASGALTIYVCNLTTKPGETDGYAASDFLREVLRYLGPGASLDCALVQKPPVPAVGDSRPVVADDECRALARHVVLADLAGEQSGRHDPQRLGKAILDFVAAHRR